MPHLLHCTVLCFKNDPRAHLGVPHHVHCTVLCFRLDPRAHLGVPHHVHCTVLYSRYDPQTNQWSSDVAPTSSCRTSVGVAVLDNFMYAVGGQDGVSCLNFVERSALQYTYMYQQRARFLSNILTTHSHQAATEKIKKKNQKILSVMVFSRCECPLTRPDGVKMCQHAMTLKHF